MREVVYEAARLALRWQVQEQWPQLSIIQSRSHISELEDAITRLEVEAAGPNRHRRGKARLRGVSSRPHFERPGQGSSPHRVASMIFDAAGKPVVTTPATDTWLIRDQGFDLRVSPMRESPKMVMPRPEDPEFSFPSGRYELMLGGQAYDFCYCRRGDRSRCVEGVATVRGPVFYECKPVR